ncbi:HAD family hydrolase [Streptomyces sp. NPDC102381]|uniref:HAD family hydrolase n=1 Tax=Streptomyces sp. NPDC102381 TaxID=3366164 RepID=UPI00382B4959
MPLPLLLLDLDNTLVDRDAAFRAAVVDFLGEYGLAAADVGWVMELDGGGYVARGEVAAAMADRYGDVVPVAAVRALLDGGGADRVVLAEDARDALVKARAGGWSCGIVTNGRTAQQVAKIRASGLDRLVQGWVVSEAVGRKKPDPEIFRAAADAVGVPLERAWVVGDSPHADIAGAHALGLRSVWVSGGRAWAAEGYRPTHVAVDVAGAIHHVIRSA